MTERNSDPQELSLNKFKEVLQNAQAIADITVLPWQKKLICESKEVFNSSHLFLETLDHSGITRLLERVDSSENSELLINSLLRILLLLSSACSPTSPSTSTSASLDHEEIEDIKYHYECLTKNALNMAHVCNEEFQMSKLNKLYDRYRRYTTAVLNSPRKDIIPRSSAKPISNSRFRFPPENSKEATYVVTMTPKNILLEMENTHVNSESVSDEDKFSTNLPTSITRQNVLFLESFVKHLTTLLSTSKDRFSSTSLSKTRSTLETTLSNLVGTLKTNKQTGRLRPHVCCSDMRHILTMVDDAFLEISEKVGDVQSSLSRIIGVTDYLFRRITYSYPNHTLNLMISSRFLNQPWWWPFKNAKTGRCVKYLEKAKGEVATFLYDLRRSELNYSDAPIRFKVLDMVIPFNFNEINQCLDGCMQIPTNLPQSGSSEVVTAVDLLSMPPKSEDNEGHNLRQKIFSSICTNTLPKDRFYWSTEQHGYDSDNAENSDVQNPCQFTSDESRSVKNSAESVGKEEANLLISFKPGIVQLSDD